MARAYVGTSGFNYKEWKPSFYPQDLAQKDWLRHYATELPTVELDNTFYRMPNRKKIATWTEATPDSFRFSLKASRRITHQERLKLPSESLTYLHTITRQLGGRLAATLYQLPPYQRGDPAKLRAFLEALPDDLPAAFEFRHESWFTDEVFDLLRRKNAALCINDGDDGSTPVEITASFTYLRLRRSEYPPEREREWQARIFEWLGRGIDVFAYVKHEENPDAPRIAAAWNAALASPTATL